MLIYGLEQIKEEEDGGRKTSSVMEKATRLSRSLLCCRSPDAIYHRIRNLRKKNNGQTNIVKDYFEFGRLPRGATVPVPTWDPTMAVAPMRQPQENIPKIWEKFISNLLSEAQVCILDNT